jgi:hypothetical protein
LLHEVTCPGCAERLERPTEIHRHVKSNTRPAVRAGGGRTNARGAKILRRWSTCSTATRRLRQRGDLSPRHPQACEYDETTWGSGAVNYTHVSPNAIRLLAVPLHPWARGQ